MAKESGLKALDIKNGGSQQLWVSRWALLSAVLSALVSSVGAVSIAHAEGVEERTDDRRHNGAKLTQETPADGKQAETSDDSERLHDSYQPKGIEMGSFLLLPKIEFDEKYNSNIFATDGNEQGDFITTVRPEMKLRSRFRQHELNLSARAEQQVYARFSDDNRLDGGLSANGRYDVSSQTELHGGLSLDSGHEDRSSRDDANGKEPASTLTTGGTVSGKHKAGLWTFEGGAGATHKSFGDVEMATGGITANGDRDRWEYNANQRVSYEIFPGYAAVGEISENMHRFDETTDRNGYQRDSQGYRVETGVAVDVTDLIRGDFLVGYLSQNYEDSRLSDPSGLSFRASFNWTPSKITIVIPSLERSVSDTTTARASSLVRDELGLIVRHELQRNIILTGMSSVSHEMVEGVNTQDAMVYDLKGRVIYAFTPEVYVGTELGWKLRDSEAAGSDYSQWTTMVRLGLQY